MILISLNAPQGFIFIPTLGVYAIAKLIGVL